jgi:hypothetical protein
MEWVEIFDRYEPDAAENIRNVTPVYTTPPAAQRKSARSAWVGLTDEEILIMSQYDLEYAALIGKVERKLRSKNGY